jgi:membrane-associated phospholipid phosphatase
MSGIVDGVSLIPTRSRRVALVVAVLGWVVAVALGFRYAGGRRAGGFDTAVTHGLRDVVGNPTPLGKWAVLPPTVATRLLGVLSEPLVIYSVIVTLVGFALWRRRWEVAALAVLAPGLCVALTEVFKPLVDRMHAGYLSYPSGHTVSSVSAYTVALLVVTAEWNGLRRLLAWVVWALVVLGVTAGLVAMNYHYPTDTIGGVGVALGVVLPAAILADTLGSRRRTRRGTTGDAPVGTARDNAGLLG